jgi:hypothetical protein
VARPKPAPAGPATASAKGATVTVVGGGLAGLTVAFELASRGYQVTLYETKETLGGNLSSDLVNGVYHDVYPHMFCAWYSNFWNLYGAQLNIRRDDQFEAHAGVKLLKRGAKDYQELLNASNIDAVVANLQSGVMSAPDMFLMGFSMLDLASTPFDRTKSNQLEQLDVNGFIYSRGYSTERVAKLQNYILMVIWSIRSELTAASSYQDFIKHTLSFPDTTPFAYLLRGSTYEKLIEPFERRLQTLGCDIRKATAVRSVTLVDGKPRIRTQAGGGAEIDAPPTDYVVFATPPGALAHLILTGPGGERIVDAVPELAELRALRCEAIPVADVYFKRKIDGFPKDQVALTESAADLTVLDISQLWTGDPNMQDRTAVVLAASNGYALPSANPQEQGFLMIRTLHDYLPVFNPGAYWGDPDSDIDWDKSLFRSNEANKIFLNEVGSWGRRPVAAYPALPNVFFAGDFCQTEVDMATVEAAVESGMNAAAALQEADARATGRPLVQPVVTLRHKVDPEAVLLAAKLALLPVAYAATAWSNALESSPEKIAQDGPLKPNQYLPSTYSLVLPLAFALDWWKTAYWLGRKAFPGMEGTGEPDQNAPSYDFFGDLEKIAGQISQALQPKTAPIEAPAEPPPPPKLGPAFAAFVDQAWRTAQVGYTAAQKRAGMPEPDPPPPGPYRRRWRAKS